MVESCCPCPQERWWHQAVCGLEGAEQGDAVEEVLDAFFVRDLR